MHPPEFWHRATPGWPGRLLQPAACLFAAAGRWRWRRTTPHRIDIPVICVGNLVVGGAGKTPVALAIGRRLQARGVAVHFLSRGYGGRNRGPVMVDPASDGTDAVGDEPLLLASVAPTWVARDRAAGADAAVAAGAGAIVMDDGFQNPGLAKDLSVLVVDPAIGIGNGRVMPAGPLREPVADGLARADAIVELGDHGDADTGWYPTDLPILSARTEVTNDVADLAGQAVLGFAGIARPEKFFQTLETIGCRVVATRSFPDHHPYSPDDVMRLVDAAAEVGAIPVTTAKDAVRWPADARAMVRTVEIKAVFAMPDELDRLLSPVLGHG